MYCSNSGTEMREYSSHIMWVDSYQLQENIKLLLYICLLIRFCLICTRDVYKRLWRCPGVLRSYPCNMSHNVLLDFLCMMSPIKHHIHTSPTFTFVTILLSGRCLRVVSYYQFLEHDLKIYCAERDPLSNQPICLNSLLDSVI